MPKKEERIADQIRRRETRQHELREWVSRELLAKGYSLSDLEGKVPIVFEGNRIEGSPGGFTVEGFYVENDQLFAFVKEATGPVPVTIPPKGTDPLEGATEISDAEIVLSRAHPADRREEAREALTESLQHHVPAEVAEKIMGEMGRSMEGVLDWVEKATLDLGDPENVADAMAATALFKDMAEAMLTGTSGDEFRDLVGDDWEALPIKDVTAAMRLVLGPEILAAPISALKRADDEVQADMARGIRSYSEHMPIPVSFMRDRPYTGYLKGTDAIPEFFSGDGGEFEIVPIRNEVWLSTPVLRNLTKVVREQGALRPLDEYLVARLDPNGHHYVRLAYRFTRFGQRDFMRVAITLKLYQQATVEEAICDIPVRQFGVMLANLKESPGGGPSNLRSIVDRALAKGGRVQVRPALPPWVGTQSMKKVWEAQESIWDLAFSADVMGVDGLAQSIFQKTDGALDFDSARRMAEVGSSPRAIFSGHALDQMQGAVPIIVEPAQVEALPEWENEQNLWDYADELTMPHDTIYLDFEGPGGIVPTIKHQDPKTGRVQSVRMRGALVYRDEDDHLIVMPVGWPAEGGQRGIRESGREIDGIGWGDLDFTGRVVFNGDTPAGEVTLSRMTGDVLDPHLVDYNRLLATVPTATVARALRSGHVQLGAPGSYLPGRVELPVGSNHMASVTPGGHLNDQAILGWAGHVFLMAQRAVAALSILEAEEIELVQVQIHKRERKRAEGRGWPIAEQVRIKPVPKRYVYTGGDHQAGEPRNFQYCFWRRGHVRHHPVGSRIADAKPDLVTECPRKIGSCGQCRRVKVKPCIVGPRDRPLKAKSLVIESSFDRDPLEDAA